MGLAQNCNLQPVPQHRRGAEVHYADGTEETGNSIVTTSCLILLPNLSVQAPTLPPPGWYNLRIDSLADSSWADSSQLESEQQCPGPRWKSRSAACSCSEIALGSGSRTSSCHHTCRAVRVNQVQKRSLLHPGRLLRGSRSGLRLWTQLPPRQIGFQCSLCTPRTILTQLCLAQDWYSSALDVLQGDAAAAGLTNPDLQLVCARAVLTLWAALT